MVLKNPLGFFGTKKGTPQTGWNFNSKLKPLKMVGFSPSFESPNFQESFFSGSKMLVFWEGSFLFFFWSGFCHHFSPPVGASVYICLHP